MPWRAWARQTVRKASSVPSMKSAPSPAVDVEVDEAGCQETALQVDAGPGVVPRLRVGPDRGNPCPVNLDPCPREQPVFEDHGAAVEGERSHTSFTRFRVLRQSRLVGIVVAGDQDSVECSSRSDDPGSPEWHPTRPRGRVVKVDERFLRFAATAWQPAVNSHGNRCR